MLTLGLLSQYQAAQMIKEVNKPKTDKLATIYLKVKLNMRAHENVTNNFLFHMIAVSVVQL